VTSTSDVAIGFAANRVLANSVTGTMVQSGQYAFTVPLAGFISNLQASVDVHAVPNTAQALLTYTFTVQRSTCIASAGGQTMIPYTSPLMSAAVTFGPITTTDFPTGQYLSNTAATATGAVPVAQGDRLVVTVTSNQATTPPALDELGLNASLLYALA